MDKSPEAIRQEMEETRHSLQNKLETLEQQVKETVSEATETVSTVKDTVDAVKETMQETASAVKETVHDTVSTVKESVHETVQSVRETLDLRKQVDEHPWAMMAGAVAVGYVGGKMLFNMLPERPAEMTTLMSTSPQPEPERTSGHRGNGHGGARKHRKHAEPATSGILGFVTQHFNQELTMLKNMAIGAAGNMVRELLVNAAPEPLADRIKEVVDGLTEKLGGQPMEGSILQPGAAGEGEGRPFQSEQKHENDPRFSRFAS